MEKKSLIRSILKKEPDPAVIDELAELLTGHPDMKVPLKELTNASARLKVQLRQDFGSELKKFYRRFLEKCLEKKVLNAEDWRSLQRLKSLFGFSNSTVEQIHNRIIMRRYSQSLEQALMDKKLDPKDRAFLKTIDQGVKLLPAQTERIYRDKASELVQRALVNMISDQRLSPDEEKELDSIAQHLGARIEFDDKTKSILDRYRFYWLVENGEIPSIETGLPLARNEKCYFTADANWCEVRSITRSARYGKAGTEVEEKDEIQREVFHELIQMDSGRLYLTNKRIVFLGEKRERAIPLVRITDFVPMENGIQIHYKPAKHPFLQFELGVEVFSLMLGRVLRDTKS